MPSVIPPSARLDQSLGHRAKHIDIDWFILHRPQNAESLKDIPSIYIEKAIEAALIVSRECPVRARKITEPDAVERIAYAIEEGFSQDVGLFTAIHLGLAGWILFDEEICDYNEPNLRAQLDAASVLFTLLNFALQEQQTFSA